MSDLKILISQFRASATRLAENSGHDQTRKYARIVSRIDQLFDELKSHGEPGLDEFQNLLADSNDWVRFAAGSCLINYRTDAAIAALDEIARQRGKVVSMQSAICLFTWYYDRTGKFYEPGEKIEY